MAKVRRSYTDEDKAKILSYEAEHGPKITAEHFNIVTSMIARWKRQARPVVQGRPRKWTPEKIKAVLDYRKTHTHTETLAHFKVSGGQIHAWQTGKDTNYYKRLRAEKANGATNGLGELPHREALQWLGRWRQAYFDQLKAETPSAETVLKALRGGK